MGHPRGLWVLFVTEMWERFSYYGMRALLVLYLISATGGLDADNPGFGWSEADAYRLYGLYTWAVYLTPILGGLIADRLLGTHRSLLLGGAIIAAGHLTLAATELFAIEPGVPVSLDTSPGALACFVTGLVLIIVGTGFFKPCVAVMVGQLYGEGDVRRESGFTLFYMGINVGALLAPLVAGTLGETVGWHWGFGAAAVGMIAGLITYALLRPRYLAGIGDAPERGSARADDRAMLPLDRVEWQRVGVILVLAFFGNVVFWAGFEQAGSSLNVFAAQSTDRTIWGLLAEPFPATWYQSANPLAVIVFAPLFAWLWVALAKRGLEPSTPVKFCLGLWLLGLAFIAMVAGSLQARGEGLAGPHWLLITFTVVTWGELCLSPVGLAMVTRLAPAHLQSLMMGVWYFTFSLANLLAGEVARFSTRLASGDITFVLDGLAGFFLMLVLAPIVVGTALLVLVPWLKRWMHGVK
jgi:POT family proton-dependent oligopeptide transporter